MKMSKKSKIMICCLVLAAAVAVAAVLLLNKPKTDTAQDALAKIKAKGTLVIGTEGNWSPWTYHDEQDNLTGFDVEIARLLAEELGVKAEFQEAPWDALLAGVDSDRFDIICNGVGYTEERAKSYSFTDPYCYSNKVLVVAADNEEIKTVDDLKGKKTANSASSTYAELAQQYGAELVPVDTLGETVELLQQGRVDATLNSQVSIADYLKQYPDAKIKVVQTLGGDPVAYPVKKGEEALVKELNRILAKLRDEGKLSELSVRFFDVDTTKAE